MRLPRRTAGWRANWRGGSWMLSGFACPSSEFWTKARENYSLDVRKVARRCGSSPLPQGEGKSLRIRRRRQQVAKAPHGLDDVDVHLLADSADEHLDGVRVAVKILVVEMLDQFGARHHAPGVVHQIGQEPVLVRGHLDRVAGYADPSGAGIQRHRPACQLALRVARGAAQQRADPRQHFLEMKRL